MKVQVLSFIQAKKNRETIIREKFPVIAFRDSIHSLESLFDGSDTPNLELCVDDTTFEVFTHGAHLVVFNDKHAKLVLDFIEKHKDTDVFIVHCVGGKCRSGAVGLFINDMFNEKGSEDDKWFWMTNAQVDPNCLIMSELKQEFERRTIQGEQT